MDGWRQRAEGEGRTGGDERASGLLSDRRISRDDEDDEDNCGVPSPPRVRFQQNLGHL